MVNRKSIRDVSITAHLCPPRFNGIRSCCVNRLINQLCKVSSRLFNHRCVGVGYRSQGSVNARAIRGIPIYVGLMNWSKKFSAMVSFRGLFLVLLWFVGWARC